MEKEVKAGLVVVALIVLIAVGLLLGVFEKKEIQLSPEEGLVAYYKFEGNADDETGRNNGVNNGVGFITDVKRGNVASFSGSSYINIGKDSGLNFDDENEFSLEAWVKPGELAGNHQFIINKWGYGNSYILRINTNNKFELVWNDGATRKLEATGKSLEIEKWYHVISTFKQNEQRIYVDGEEINPASFGGSLASDAGDVYIGKQVTGANYFKGSLDEVKLWNRALTKAEVEQYQHPRLFIFKEDIADLKSKINIGVPRQIWEALKERADSEINDKVLYSSELDRRERALRFALAYLLEEDEAKKNKYAEASYKTIEELFNSEGWHSSWYLNGSDGASSRSIFVAAVVYDWVYDYLDESRKSQIENKLRYEIDSLYNNYLKKYGKNTYTNGHYQDAMQAVYVGERALKNTDTAKLNFVDAEFGKLNNYLPRDGSWHEGPYYWQEYIGAFLPYYELKKQLEDVNLFSGNSWLPQTYVLPVYYQLPDKLNVVNFGDAFPRISWSSKLFFLLAREYNNGYFQDFAMDNYENINSLILTTGRGGCNHCWHEKTGGGKSEIIKEGDNHILKLTQESSNDFYVYQKFSGSGEVIVRGKAKALNERGLVQVCNSSGNCNPCGIAVSSEFAAFECSRSISDSSSFVEIRLRPRPAGQYPTGNVVYFDDVQAFINSENKAYNSGFELNELAIDSVFDLLWYDNVNRANTNTLGLEHHFVDTGLFVKRDSWNEDSSYFTFKSGIPGGYWINVKRDSEPELIFSSAHDHPDENSFIYYAGGEVLLKDQGYTWLKKTANHNTIVVNNLGQLGEGSQWNIFSSVVRQDRNISSENKGKLEIIESNQNYTIVRGDASKMYPVEAGLNKYNRTILYTEDFFVVLDRVELANSGNVDWFFHSDGEINSEEASFTTLKNKLNLKIFNSGEFNKIVEDTNITYIDGQEKNSGKHLKLSKQGTALNFLGVFYLDGRVGSVQYSGNIVKIDGVDTVRFNLDTGELRYERMVECYTDADTNCDGAVDRAELGEYIMLWIAGEVTRESLGEAIMAWAV